jgi:hypothetical protein
MDGASIPPLSIENTGDFGSCDQGDICPEAMGSWYGFCFGTKRQVFETHLDVTQKGPWKQTQ